VKSAADNTENHRNPMNSIMGAYITASPLRSVGARNENILSGCADPQKLGEVQQGAPVRQDLADVRIHSDRRRVSKTRRERLSTLANGLLGRLVCHAKRQRRDSRGTGRGDCRGSGAPAGAKAETDEAAIAAMENARTNMSRKTVRRLGGAVCKASIKYVARPDSSRDRSPVNLVDFWARTTVTY
jgi:hypothetical protein